MENSNDADGKSPLRKMKKCPECFTYIAIDDKVCHSCKAKVGKIGKDGIALRPINWMSYIRALMMWVIFGLYIWWAFLREK